MLQNLYFSPIKNYKMFCTEVSEHTEKNRVRRKMNRTPLCEKLFLVAPIEKTFIE